jgi:hypothetical protein
VNRFLVTYSPQLAALYPDHVRHTSFFGRLINHDTIVNVIPSLYHDDVLMGYVVEFDLRDVGEYWLQLGVDWYFGDSEPETTGDPSSVSTTVSASPTPQCVSGFQGLYSDYRKSDERRALVHWGREIRVVMNERGESLNVPVFGRRKCVDGEAAGRWLNMGEKACEAPYCTGNRTATVNNIDWVQYLEVFMIPVFGNTSKRLPGRFLFPDDSL